MATAEELRAAIEQGREALKSAIEGAGDRWEQSSGGEWSPQQAAQHAIGTERYFAGQIATVMQGRPPEQVELALGSSGDAIEALNAAAEDFNRVVRYVEDRDLEKASESGSTIQSILDSAASHLNEHAQQISG